MTVAQARTAFSRTGGRCFRCGFPVGMLEAQHAVARARLLMTGSDADESKFAAVEEQLRVFGVRAERPMWVPIKDAGVGPLVIVCASCHDKQVANEKVLA